MKAASVNSIAFRTCLFFAINPEESLTTGDIAIKYGYEPHSVRYGLKRCIATGWLNVALDKGKESVYSAGPELLKFARPVESNKQGIRA